MKININKNELGKSLQLIGAVILNLFFFGTWFLSGDVTPLLVAMMLNSFACLILLLEFKIRE